MNSSNSTITNMCTTTTTTTNDSNKRLIGEEDMWEDKLSEYRIGGWRPVSAAGSQDTGCHRRIGSSQRGVRKLSLDSLWGSSVKLGAMQIILVGSSQRGV